MRRRGVRGAGGKVCPGPAHFWHGCPHKSMRSPLPRRSAAQGRLSPRSRARGLRPESGVRNRLLELQQPPRPGPAPPPESTPRRRLAGGAQCSPGGLQAAGPRRGCRSARRRGCMVLGCCGSVVRAVPPSPAQRCFASAAATAGSAGPRIARLPGQGGVLRRPAAAARLPAALAAARPLPLRPRRPWASAAAPGSPVRKAPEDSARPGERLPGWLLG